MRKITVTAYFLSLRLAAVAAVLWGGSRLGAGTLPQWLCTSMKVEAGCYIGLAALGLAMKRVQFELTVKIDDEVQ